MHPQPPPFLLRHWVPPAQRIHPSPCRGWCMTPKAGNSILQSSTFPSLLQLAATWAEVGTHGFPASLPPRSLFLFCHISSSGIFPGSGTAGQAAHGIPCPNTAAPLLGRGTFPGLDLLSLSHPTRYVSTDARLGASVNASINIRSTSQIASKETDVPGKAGKAAVPCPWQLGVGRFQAAPSMRFKSLSVSARLVG